MAFAQVDIPDNRLLLLNEAITGQVEVLRRTLSDRVDFNVAISEVAMQLRADQDKLEAMVQHLLSNAVDAVAEGGDPKIELSLEVSEGAAGHCHACLTVTDNGCGIASEHLHQIFDPFFTTKAPGKGTGMGLALVYGVVHALNGEIRAESVKDAGTTIRIRLPLEEGDADSDSSKV